jgi:autotransporter-associated beta strand protein
MIHDRLARQSRRGLGDLGRIAGGYSHTRRGLVLIASAGLGALATLAPEAARAIDGTWQGPGTEWTTGTNWSSSPTAPDNTATFTNNGAPTSVNISTSTSINTMLFTLGAPGYSFTLGTSTAFTIAGAGIVNAPSNAPNFFVGPVSTLSFINSSTAGNAVITNNASGFSAVTSFFNSSTAGNATIINTNLGFTSFNDTSTAGNATITSSARGFLAFLGSATAGNANITNNAFGSTTFSNSSTAGNSTITTNFGGFTTFTNTSTAGNANVITNSGGTTQFSQFSTGGNAAFTTQAGGVFDMSGLIAPAMTAGSIEGQGTYFLGSNALIVGGNNLSTTVAGTISDGGASGGTGGSLVKVGTGTLTLSGINSYTGATIVNGGTLSGHRRHLVVERSAGDSGRHARGHGDGTRRPGGGRNFGAGPANRHRHAQRQG